MGQGSLGYGFRAGLSFSQLSGDKEMDAQGNELEKFTTGSGFHIGINVAYKFTDLVGLRGEFLFSQRGNEYEYNGESYYILGLHQNEVLNLRGTRNMTLSVTNAYVDIPLSLYYKLGRLEISGGAGIGLNVGSSAGGRIQFEGLSPTSNQPITPFTIALNYDYRANTARGIEDSFTDVQVDSRVFNIPDRVGAYYWFEEAEKNLYKGVNAYLLGGLSFYLNEGLYLGARVYYGLTDEDRNEYDVSLRALDANGDYVFRNDMNRNINIQASIGFSF